MPCLPPTGATTLLPAVYLPVHPFGKRRNGAHVTPFFKQNNHVAPSFHLPAHPFGVSLEGVYATPTLLWHTELGTSRLPAGPSFSATPGRAYVTPSLHRSTHVAPSLLSTGTPIWCSSRMGQCHAYPLVAHPLRHQSSSYRRTHLVHLEVGLISHVSSIKTPTSPRLLSKEVIIEK